jgi:hypothetical protein
MNNSSYKWAQMIDASSKYALCGAKMIRVVVADTVAEMNPGRMYTLWMDESLRLRKVGRR